MNDTQQFDNILSQAVSGYMNEWLFSDEFREDEFKTSESFEKKMAKMIKSQYNVYHKLTLTRVRKVLCIAAIIVALLLSSLSVGAVRELVANLFVKHYSDHDKLTANLEGTYPTKLEKLYELSYIPKGYELYDKSILDIGAEYLYMNDNDEMIWFSQDVKETFSIDTDNESSTQTTEIYNGQEYYINDHNDGSYTFVWDNGEYIFELWAYLPKETMLDLCNSLKIK